MVDVEKIKKGLDTCALRSAGDCTSCPYFENTYCNDLLASDAAEYIESLEERIAIKDEALEALEQRCKELEALEKRQAGITWHNFQEKLRPIVIKCSTCGKTLYAPSPFCPHCGARMCEVSK